MANYIIKVKGEKGKCPVCKKWVELEFNTNMNLNVLSCCDTSFSLFPLTKPKKKRKIRKKGKKS